MMNEDQVNAIFEKLAYDAVAMKRAEDVQNSETEQEVEKNANRFTRALDSGIGALQQGAEAVANNPGTSAAMGLGATGTGLGAYGSYKGQQATNRQENVVGPAIGQLYGQAAHTEMEDRAQGQAIEQIVNRKQQLAKELQRLQQAEEQARGQNQTGQTQMQTGQETEGSEEDNDQEE